MATPGQLVKAISEALGIPEATVIEVDRNLAAAGLRTMKGRGRGAAKITARDAACHLIALMSIGFPGSLSVKASADLVRSYIETMPHLGTSGDFTNGSFFGKLKIDRLHALQPEHSFIDGLEVVLTAAGADQLNNFDITIAVQQPTTMGAIRLASASVGQSAFVKYSHPNPWDRHQSRHPPKAEVEQWQAKVAARRIETDITQYREITHKTIGFIGKLIAA